MDAQQQHACVECNKNELRTKKCPTMYLQASVLPAGMADAKLEERSDNERKNHKYDTTGNNFK